LYFIILFVGLYYAYEFFTMEYGENYKLTAQLTGGLAGGSVVSRFEVWMGGISMLDSSEFFTGAGLTSVLVSGPHNDYITNEIYTLPTLRYPYKIRLTR